MKYSILTYPTLIHLLLLCFSPPSWSQANTAPLESYRSTINFTGEFFEEEVVFIITEESQYLRLDMHGKIRDGKVSAILYTESGRKVCGLSLDAKASYAKGTMGEELAAREGIYKLKIKNDTGRGHLTIDFSQY